MDDMVLRAKLDETTTIYVSPIAAETYAEYVDDDNLGGDGGYFVLRSMKGEEPERFEVLAKAVSFEAASELFDLIVGTRVSAMPTDR